MTDEVKAGITSRVEAVESLIAGRVFLIDFTMADGEGLRRPPVITEGPTIGTENSRDSP